MYTYTLAFCVFVFPFIYSFISSTLLLTYLCQAWVNSQIPPHPLQAWAQSTALRTQRAAAPGRGILGAARTTPAPVGSGRLDLPCTWTLPHGDT